MADYEKQLTTTWNGDFLGTGVIESYGLKTEIAVPNALGGSGMGAGPKDLLVASAAACYVMTLVAMIDGRKIPVDALSVETRAVDTRDTGFNVEHHVQLTLSAHASDDQVRTANALVPKADATCAIGNMLRKADVQIAAIGTVSTASAAANA